MKFTAQEEYGLRCMLQFARQLHGGQEAAAQTVPPVQDDQGPRAAKRSTERSLTIGEIAEIEGITPQYAGKLIRILRMGGLLESVRGRHGGYRLAHPIEQISVGEVLAALGGRVYQADYCSRYSGERKMCVHTVDCAIRSLWSGLQDLVDRVLSQVRLVDLLGTEKGMAEWLIPILGIAEEKFPILNIQAAGAAGRPESAAAAALADSKQRKEHR